jgi:hypothetical protein
LQKGLQELKIFRWGREKKWPQLDLAEIRKRSRLLVVDDSEFPHLGTQISVEQGSRTERGGSYETAFRITFPWKASILGSWITEER